jgi:hypothetical protein
MKLVFVHGINHEGLSSDWVRDAWLEALGSALPAADMALIRQQTISAPFYGDVLRDYTEGLTAAKGAVQAQSAGAAEGDEAVFYQDVLTQLADAKSIPQDLIDTNEATVQQGAFFHNRRVIALTRALETFSPLHGKVLLRALPQAFTYLKRAQAAMAIDKIVQPALADGPCIVVGHSLGTVVTFKLLRNFKCASPFYLTMGSPLAIRAVQGPLGTPLGRRPGVSHWMNVFDKDDFVTIGRPLDSTTFGGGVQNTDVDNGAEDPHDFRKYLAHPDVASALVAAIRLAA